MAVKKTPAHNIPAKRLEQYEEVIGHLKGIERKGASMPYTSLNGHMFSFLVKDGSLALRLPEEEREAFIKKHKTTLCEQHGVVLKEYVAVPEKLWKKTSELQEHFATSYNYIKTLKPKATTKGKK
jgi:TfoX/Sxy family transcriptional regulator of competence genes